MTAPVKSKLPLEASNDRPRVEAVVNALVTELHRIIREYRVSDEELKVAMDFVTALGKNNEAEGFADAFALTTAADNVTHENLNGATDSNIEGPFYRAGAPMLARPHRLGREGEPGDLLFFSGVALNGSSRRPLSGALVDIWQSDSKGLYENQDPTQPDFNLRGRLLADDAGSFEFRTVVPGAYEIPKDGAVGKLLKMLERHAFRPRHIHFKITQPGYQPLTTQIYFEGDEWLDSDSIGAAKPQLVTRLEKQEASSDEGIRRRAVRPFFTSSFTFRLIPSK